MVTFFLWPMVVPIFIPVLYCWKYKPESLKRIWPILLSMILIVLLYEPLMWNLDFPIFGYIFWKFVLFVLLPLGVFAWLWKGKPCKEQLKIFGVKGKGSGKSLKLALFLLPLMLIAELAVAFWLDRNYMAADAGYSAIMFFESFTEEFFFRGILFLYLWRATDIRVAYVTSITSFVLMHPQYFWGPGMLLGVVQGILTALIVHKSKNLAGAWVLHGANRVFSISVLPWIL